MFQRESRKSAQRSAIMMEGALVLPLTSVGMTEASAIRRRRTPRTLSDKAKGFTVLLLSALEIEAGQQSFHSVMVHHEDDVPIQLEDRFVNPVVAPDYLRQDFSRTTPNAFLTSIAPIDRTEQFIEAVLPQPWECKLLAIARSEPCILIRRRTWSRARVVTSVRLLYPGSRYRLQSNF